jgi:hypothetical protein
MTTSIERRVSEGLRAFADITVTEGDIVQAHQQLKEQVAVERQRKSRGLLVAAAAALIACVVGAWWLSHTDTQTGAPAVNQPTLVPDPQADPVATSFVEAYAAFDMPRATSLLDDKARMSGFDWGGDWRKINRFLAGTGASLILQQCTEVDTTAAGTAMRCPFDYHALHSDELGRGPFGGSYFDVTVSDGLVVDASMELDYTSNTFSTDMWEPFADWVSTTHPRDAAVMYADWPGMSMQRLSPESIRLWNMHTRDYVSVVLARRAAAAPGGPG